MPLKSCRAARLSILLLSVFLLLPLLSQAEQKTRVKEGHKPRTKTAQKEATSVEREGDGDRENPRGREQWFLQGRLYKGRPAPQLLMKAQRQRDVLRRQAYQARMLREAARAWQPKLGGTGTQGWSELGPSPLRSVTTTGDDQDYGMVTGRVTAVAVDQNDGTGNTVYIGGAYGGVWKSTTAANPDPTKVVWTPVTDDQPTLAVGAIAIDPADSNIVLVGTGEANSSSDSYYGLGILRSTDAGNSWALISSANNGLRPFHGLAFAKLAFKSDNPSIVVAATAAASEGITVGAEQPANSTTDCNNSSITATCRGLYYSLDSGQTWSQVMMVDPSGAPDNGSASDVLYNPIEQKFYAWSRAHGLYTSPDGMTFTRAVDQGTGSNVVVQPANTINLTNCPSTPVNLQTCPIYRGEITQVPGRDEMYVWFVDSKTTPTNGGIYQTLDGGKTWNRLNTASIDGCGDSNGCSTEQGDYNLVLTAVPNGQATDLYAGAINIYRCQINSNNPTCTASPFLNLTHVYGCTPTGSFSKVHPDEHSFDFLQLNPNIIYFGNDGGIYRTLASENGAVVPSSCPGSAPSQPFYPFDNLNGTMGSMTQFVWFQQHPTNQYTLLGGTQDNGSPAIDSSNSGGNGITWRSVLGGDGGWTDINPNNRNEWFSENTGLNPGIQRCPNGTNCSDSQFIPVITAAKVGADAAAFYMPFMLDPQNSSQIILGTCRVWRVPSSGVGVPANALSQTFDGSSSCSSSSTSFVSSLAAGGTANSNGSQVIYAGTADGQIYVTTTATSAQTNWMKASANTGFADASNYPVSGLAIDPRDATGNTAYATVMGFQTGHVFQTTNSGGSWTDITGNLPDSPADGAVVDPSSGTIYVATDVGVFSTPAPAGSSTVWTEVGPATGVGTLPNVAVTRVAIFNPSGQPPRLRVSTYGRGIWEMPLPGSTTPDYSVSISNADLVTFPGQTVTYNGTESVFNGYNGTVTISCTALSQGSSGPLPSTCAPSLINNGAFAVTAGDPTVQDFSFRVQGSDGTLVRQAAVTLRVIDFSLGAPSPSSIPNLIRGNSATVQVGITSLGSFDQAVTLDCDPATLPAGMTCTASPVVLSAGATTQATVTINAAGTTAIGTYTPTIRATSTLDATHTIQHTQSVSVQVAAQAGFALDTSSYTRQTLKVGQALTTNVTIAPHDGYSGTVNLQCSAPGSNIPLSACTFQQSGNTISSVQVGANPVTVSLNLTTSAGTAGAQQVDVRASDATSIYHSTLPFTLTDFSIGGSLAPGNGSPGGNVSFSFQLTPLSGYNSQVTLSCDTSTLGQQVVCGFSPASPTLTPGVTTVVNATLVVPSTASSGTYAVGITATDSTFAGLAHSRTTANFTVQSNPDFSVGLSSSSATVTAGGNTSSTVSLTGSGGFNSQVTWTWTGCPQLATCTVSPASTTPGQNATLTITTTAPFVSRVQDHSSRFVALWIGLPFGAFGLVLMRRRKLIGIMTFLMLLGLAACGGGGGGGSGPPITHPGTPAGTYNIVVTGTAGTITHQQTFVLTVQ